MGCSLGWEVWLLRAPDIQRCRKVSKASPVSTLGRGGAPWGAAADVSAIFLTMSQNGEWSCQRRCCDLSRNDPAELCSHSQAEGTTPAL